MTPRPPPRPRRMAGGGNHKEDKRRPRLPPGTWSMLPKHVRDSGALASMTMAACRVYVAMVLRANWNAGGKVIMSQEELANDTGLSTRRIRDAIKRLRGLGLLRRLHKGWGKGNANEYQIIDSNPDACVPPTEDRTNTTDRSGNVAACDDDETRRSDHETIRAELSRYGITEPKLSDLISGLTGLTPEIIQRLVERTTEARNPSGKLIALLETQGPKLIEETGARSRAQQQRRKDELQKSEEAARQKQAREKEWGRIRSEISKLPDEKLARLKNKAIEATPLPIRERLRKADPRKNQPLQAAIWKVVEAEGSTESTSPDDHRSPEGEIPRSEVN